MLLLKSKCALLEKVQRPAPDRLLIELYTCLAACEAAHCENGEQDTDALPWVLRPKVTWFKTDPKVVSFSM